MKRLWKVIKEPKRAVLYLIDKKPFVYFLSDKLYLKLKFYLTMSKRLDLKSPKTFNEKLQWLKLYNRKPEYTVMVDKYKVREYISEKLGEEYLIPLIGVWDNPNDIDFDALPNQFVLKCNHNSGLGMCICKDKAHLDIDKVKKELREGVAQDYYLTSKEWPYKDVPRRIVCEKYMTNDVGEELKDYKFFCFNGKIGTVLVCSERFTELGLHEDFYDADWVKMSVKRPSLPTTKEGIAKPESFELMKKFATELSRDIPFVRVDFYELDGKVYFGEITFFPSSGFAGFEPREWDEKFGEMIILK